MYTCLIIISRPSLGRESRASEHSCFKVVSHKTDQQIHDLTYPFISVQIRQAHFIVKRISIFVQDQERASSVYHAYMVLTLCPAWQCFHCNVYTAASMYMRQRLPLRKNADYIQ